MNTEQLNEIKIGYQFKYYACKRNDIYTVIDILTTTNISGQIVDVQYVTIHDFLGSPVRFICGKSAIRRSEAVKK